MTANYITGTFAALMILVVIGKVFMDRQMTIKEATPIVMVFGLCSYALFTGGNGFIFFVIGMILLGRFYKRVAPDYKRRIHERLEANQLRNQRNG